MTDAGPAIGLSLLYRPIVSWRGPSRREWRRGAAGLDLWSVGKSENLEAAPLSRVSTLTLMYPSEHSHLISDCDRVSCSRRILVRDLGVSLRLLTDQGDEHSGW